MKRTLLVCLTLLCVTTFALAKSYTQQGIAYLYDYKTKTKKPIGNVSITVAYAEPTTSRADGTFTLAFKDFGAGKHLVFAQQPFSPGLTVLNKKETDNWSTFEGRLILIMCSKKDFDTCKQNYYDVGFKSITQRYDQKIAALKKESADYQRRLQELEEERDRIMDNLRNSADAMARIDQSELDDAMQEVLDLYERGEVDEAMKKLKDMKLEEKFLKTLDKKHEGERTVAEATEDSLLTLNKLRTSVDVYKNNGNWDKVAETLKLLADKLNAYDDVFAYAYFCDEQNDFKEAEVYWKKALDMLEKRSDTGSNDFLYQRATLLNNLANLYSNTQRLTESEKMYMEALEIQRRLAKDNPKAYEPDVAMTLNNLAILYKYTQRLTESEKMYMEALEIYRRLAKDNPKAYEPDVAMTLNNLASLYSNTQRLTESEKMYMEALEIYRRLTKDNPKAYEPYVALTLNNLALLYSNTQRFTESEKMYMEALEIRRRLTKDNPKAYEPDVAMTLSNRANLYYKTQRFTESEEKYMETLEIYRRLAKDNPKAYEPDVAATLNNLANLYSKTQRLTKSEKMYMEALEIYRRLAKDNPKAYEQYVAMTLNNLAILYKYTQRLTESEKMYMEALKIRRRLAKDNPKAYEPDVAQTLNNLASLYYNTQRLTESEKMYMEALEIYRRLAKDNPKAYEKDVAMTLNNLAILYKYTQRLTESEKMYMEALEIRRRLAKDNPKAYEPDVARTSYNTVLLMLQAERYAEAIPLFEEALEIYRRMAETDSEQQLWYISSLHYLSSLYGQQSDRQKAYQMNQELLPLLKTMYQENADGVRSDYAGELGNQSFYAIFMQQYAEAEQLAREGLAVDSTKHFIYANLAASLLLQGKYTEAEPIYRQYKDELKEGFLDDFKQFAEAGVIPKEREEDVERIKRMLEE